MKWFFESRRSFYYVILFFNLFTVIQSVFLPIFPMVSTIISPNVTSNGASKVSPVSLPKRLKTKILEGQIIKQTFSAEMARSFARDTLESSFFPLRSFVEIYHPLPVPWAEEFPLYTASVGGLSYFLSANVVTVGRLLSFLGFLVFLGGVFRLGQDNFRSPDAGWIGVCVASGFPALRVYATSVMPDMWMTAACLWTWIFALRKNWGLGGLVGAVACLIKYYAAFTIFGIALYRLSREKKGWPVVAWAAVVLAPTVVYLVAFISQSIPNPITDYVFWNGGGTCWPEYFDSRKILSTNVELEFSKKSGINIW